MLRPIAFVTGILFTLSIGCWAQAEVLLQPPAVEAKLTAEQNAVVEALRSMPATRSVDVVEVNPAALDGADETTVFLTDKRSATFKGGRKQSALKDFTWFGEAALGELGSKYVQPNIMLSIEGGDLTATIRTESEQFEVQPVGNGVHVLVDIDVTKLPPDHINSTDDEPVQDAVPMELRASADSAVAVIRVLIVITPNANREITKTTTIRSFAKKALEDANQSYGNSGVRAQLELADLQLVQYTESGLQNTDLARLRSKTDGFMDGVHQIRDTKKADIVVLVVDGSANECGVAKVAGGADYAFAVNRYSCVQRQLTFAHEIGHIMGGCHDPAHSNRCPSKPYAHGYLNAARRMVSVMAYPCTRCVRQMQWSGPPTWGRADLNYNAKVLDDNAPAVSRFR